MFMVKNFEFGSPILFKLDCSSINRNRLYSTSCQIRIPYISRKVCNKEGNVLCHQASRMINLRDGRLQIQVYMYRPCCISVTWGMQEGKCSSNIFSTPNQIFWLLGSRGANNKNWADSGGNGCTYLKGWFRSVFPMYLTGLFRTLSSKSPTPTPPRFSQLRL